jgi:hypothetical protein
MSLTFSEFNDPECTVETNIMYLQRMKVISKLVSDSGSGSETGFNFSDYYDYDLVIKIIDDYFVLNNFKTSTTYGYICALCKFLEKCDNFPSDSYIKYKLYLRQLDNKRRVEDETHILVFHPDEFLKSQTILSDKLRMMDGQKPSCLLINLKIIIKLLLLIDIDHNDYGVLRMNDLMGISLFECNKDASSYLDLSTGELTIHKMKTKTKKERKMMLPMEFCSYVNELYQTPAIYRKKREWLLCDKYIHPVKNTSSMSSMFTKYVGFPYYNLRRQFVTYFHSVGTIDKIRSVALNMGHSVEIAAIHYNRKEVDSDDDTANL